jgi:hypothetical protein
VPRVEPFLYRAILCAGAWALLGGMVSAQSRQNQSLPGLSSSPTVTGLGLHSQVQKEIKHDVSPPLRSLKPVHAHQMVVAAGRDEGAEEKERSTPAANAAIAAPAKDPIAQTQAGVSHATTAGLNFDGVTAPDGRAVPDTNGAVGATQYFQWVNTDFEIFDKISGASIYGPVDASTIWTNFAPCTETDDDDIVVEYDKMANVWVLEQHVAPPSGANYQCIAVSTTSDATGSYDRYVFNLPANFPDYPKISVWPDAYYLTMNEESNTTNAPLGAYVCALNRTSMLAGTTATSQCFQLNPAYNSLLPADLDGTILPPAGSPNYLMNLGTNALNLWQFHVDWVNPSNSTLTGPVSLPVAPFALGCKASSTCVPQLGTTQLVDGIGDRLMFRLAYRHFADGHESLVANHTINNPGPVAVRWYEVQSPANNPYIFQQSTFAPDSNNRWMGSIAMDQMGDIALGYSVSSASMYPAVRYTARLQSDPLNTLETETSIIEGTGSEVGSNRWGDYSAMSVDPVDDCTFWYTQEYFATSGDYNWNTRVASFSYPSCTGNPPVTLAPNGLYYGALNIGTSSVAQAVTLTNLQSVPLNIAGIAASGSYAESDNCVSGNPIAAGGTCTINVTFTPASAGTLTGQVTVTDDAPGGFQVVNMTGAGAAPAVSLAPASLKFTALTGSSSAAKAVTLTNSGTGPLSISVIVASGDYSETDNCVSSSPLATGATCTINVTFSPSVTGNVAGAITISDNGVNGAPHRIVLSGTGQVTIAMYPASLTFPATAVGSTSAARIVTVTNNAATAQNISWAAGGDYTVVAGGVSPCGSTMSAASGCTLSVTFSPTTNGLGGVVKGGLAVSDAATAVPYNPQSVSLTGTATGGATTNPLSFSPASLNLGSVSIGTNKSATVQVTNASGSALTLGGVAASGEYTLAAPPSGTVCASGLVLTANAKCQFTVSLTPTSGGSVLGSVTITDNAASGATVETYNLSAIGYWPITLSPPSLSFPATTIGTTSAPLQVMVTNYSKSSVTLNSFAASGDYAIETLGSSPCVTGTILATGGKCTFGVTFSPTTTGAITGAVTVSHSAPNSPQVVSLTGSGQ